MELFRTKRIFGNVDVERCLSLEYLKNMKETAVMF
ncbi:MAG: hypothetical protein ACJAYJ_004153 [Saprospiraceae bacterium]|jgi:hypothetical protein